MQYNFSGPLYEQVLGLLRTRIESGEWKHGFPLPGEVQLSRDFGVSVGTMRKAMDKLVQERIVTRERGRGTFVKEANARSAPHGFRLCDDNGNRISPQISLTKISASDATPAETKALRLRHRQSMAPRVIRLLREWRIDGQLVCEESIIVEQSRFPDLADLQSWGQETLHDTYAEHYKTPIDRAIATIKPMLSADTEANNPLDAQAMMFLRCTRIAFDNKDIPVELCEQTYRCRVCSFQFCS